MKQQGRGLMKDWQVIGAPFYYCYFFFDQLKIWKINFNIKKKSILPVKLTGREKRHNAWFILSYLFWTDPII